MIRKVLRWIVVVVAVIGLAWTADWTWRDRSYPNEKLIVAGLPNLGRVTPNLYRGGQPSSEGFAALRAMGVNTVVSFTLGDEGVKREAAEVSKLGMDFVTLPWSTTGVPEPDQIRTFLNYLRDHPERTVFAHCKAGMDRTGVMIALSRIAIDGWPTERAIDEMNAFHYHFIFLPHLQRFVERFRPDEWR